MKERPIPMNAEMVRAILDGRKTQTRRPVSPQPVRKPIPCPYVQSGWALENMPNEFGVKGCSCSEIRNPFGQPGDRLWVREPARVDYVRDEGEDGMELAIRYMADDVVRLVEVPERLDIEWQRKYIGWPVPRWVSGCQGIPNGVFREAARIILEITDVRVERVHDITIEGVKAEGVNTQEPENGWCDEAKWRGSFRHLWDLDCGYLSRNLGWASNPWVWVVEFRRVQA